MNNWISLKEKEPPKENKFLSCNRLQGKIMAVTWWNPVKKCYMATGGQSYYQFTDWTLLPEPPNE